ncbi:hypothetical protein DL93DRAFT_2194823 [Clavulina sp. PMI_390]|nr:hypothetical protein DL93DRAFT_2194823 [Clavulina sp. PMI_390]
MTSIAQVPEELMIQIFCHCVFLPHLRWWMSDGWKIIYNLMSVCKQWEQYILDCGIFWRATGIYNAIPSPRLLDERIDQAIIHYRSESTPLMMTIDGGPSRFLTHPSIPIVMQRAVSLLIIPRGDISHYQGWESVFSSHPLLETLLLWLPYQDGFNWSLVNTVLTAPRLRHLHMSIMSPYISTLASSLETVISRLETFSIILTSRGPLESVDGWTLWSSLGRVLSMCGTLKSLAVGVPYTFSRGTPVPTSPTLDIEYLLWTGPIGRPLFHVSKLVRLDLQDSLFHIYKGNPVLPFIGVLETIKYLSVWEQPVYGVPQFERTIHERIEPWSLLNRLPNLQVIQLRMGHPNLHYKLITQFTEEDIQNKDPFVKYLELIIFNHVLVGSEHEHPSEALLSGLSSSRPWAEIPENKPYDMWEDPPFITTWTETGLQEWIFDNRPSVRVRDATGRYFGAHLTDKSRAQLDEVARAFVNAGRLLDDHYDLYRIHASAAPSSKSCRPEGPDCTPVHVPKFAASHDLPNVEGLTILHSTVHQVHPVID